MINALISTLKKSGLASLLIKAGIRKSTLARKIYGKLTKTKVAGHLNIGGFKIYPDSNDSLGLSQKKDFFEKSRVAKVMRAFVKPGQITLDIGANIGVYSLLLAKLVGKKGKVYSFEPDGDNFRTLVKNTKLNRYENVVFIKKAVSDKTGRIKLYLSEWNKGDHRIYPSDENRESVEIESISLDDFFRVNKEKISFIKIDTQGAEALLFKGGKKFFKDKKPIVFLEFWPVGISGSGEDPEEFLRQMNANFKIYSGREISKEITPGEILAEASVKKRNYIDLLCVPRRKNL
ncbi:MAG: FkbM family methyltransferase [Nanoarchaeota archaeon]